MTWEECKPTWVGDMLHESIHIAAVYDEQRSESEIVAKTKKKWKTQIEVTEGVYEIGISPSILSISVLEHRQLCFSGQY
jgi:hypothetical protein